ncbi:class I SAM-dependent methyltransferase [Aestuariivirga sp.]|uniref:class I SAM-dependent methyltransferase n=1 Tax=Aestuariivirga sp. TaxID=2650926 RepID=UPI00391ADCB0
MVDPDGRAVPGAISPSQDLFVNSWDVYRKMVDNDYLSHRGAYAALRSVLLERGSPFSFIDVACGDAGMSVQALAGTPVREYVGIDISQDAISRARAALPALGCTHRFCLGDFRELLSGWSSDADVVWIGLSLHHLALEEKGKVMSAVRRILQPAGHFLVYDESCLENETRSDWLARWDAQESSWSAYTPEEWRYVCSHVHGSDFPESEPTWRKLGKDSGFSRFSKLYESSSNLFSLYCFQP